MMNQIVHEIVSHFDTIIVLKNPCIDFAEWGQPVASTAEEIEEATQEYLAEKKRRESKKSETVAVPCTCHKEQLADAGTAPPDNGGPGSAINLMEENTKMNGKSIFDVEAPEKREIINNSSKIVENETQGVEPVPEITAEPTEEEGIRFRVCAGNLMSASASLNIALKRNGWMESYRVSEDKCFHISAEDWDEEAFVILMNIFHLRNRRVPREISLELLAKIAILADYYKCDESIELFIDKWVENLIAKTPIPTTYCRDLILWVWISWTFKLSDLFKRATAVVIEQCTEPVQNLALPIPAWITGMHHLGHAD